MRCECLFHFFYHLAKVLVEVGMGYLAKGLLKLVHIARHQHHLVVPEGDGTEMDVDVRTCDLPDFEQHILDGYFATGLRHIVDTRLTLHSERLGECLGKVGGIEESVDLCALGGIKVAVSMQTTLRHGINHAVPAIVAKDRKNPYPLPFDTFAFAIVPKELADFYLVLTVWRERTKCVFLAHPLGIISILRLTAHRNDLPVGVHLEQILRKLKVRILRTFVFSTIGSQPPQAVWTKISGLKDFTAVESVLSSLITHVSFDSSSWVKGETELFRFKANTW